MIFGLFKKEKERKEIVRAEIDFTDWAREYCVFTPRTLKIFIKVGDRVVDVLDYNSYNLQKIEGKIPIVERFNMGECGEIKEALLLGRLVIKKSFGIFGWIV